MRADVFEIREPWRGPLTASAREHKHVIVGINGHGGHFVQHLIGGQHRPTMDNAVESRRRGTRCRGKQSNREGDADHHTKFLMHERKVRLTRSA